MYRLITAQDIKTISKGGEQFGNDFDYLLDEILIPAIGALFANYCKRPDFDRALRTQYFSPGECCGRLFLSSTPIVQDPTGNPVIPNVRVWQDTARPRAYGSTTELINGEDFFVYEEEGIIERWGWFAWGPKTIKVTYTGGYLTADAQGVPADLRLAAITQAKILFDRREEYGMTGRSLEAGSINLLSIITLPRQVTMLLDRFVVPNYANAA